jgi:hypothetical protein
MQLNAPARGGSIRQRLSAAACVLLATSMPPGARADSGTQLDASLLTYGEQGRAKVVEPTVRVTRLFPDGQSLSGQISVDVITGASPTGALPSGVIPPGEPEGGDRVQTVTAASGGAGGGGGGEDPGALPTASFHDVRAAFDTNWQKPFGPVTPMVSGHFSRERDYQSIGGTAKVAIEFMHKLSTLTLGAGINRDNVFPSGGTRAPLTDGTVILGTDWNPKDVNGGLVGLSRILTRRWMLGVTASRSVEEGWLTDPYKVVSVMDPVSGLTVGELTESRPTRRERQDVLTSTVYHLSRDVLYLSHRYYWDDWGVHSNTVDLKYRVDTGDGKYFEPHARYYWQAEADFFRLGLVQGDPLPTFVSSDERLGRLRTFTVGANYGFTVPKTLGEWNIRAEYIRQFGEGSPSEVVGVQQQFDLFPPVNIGSLVITYSVPL